MEFIESWLPLIVCVREGNREPDEVLQLAAGFERHFERNQAYAVLIVARLQAPPPSASVRLRLSAWANQPRVRRYSRELCAGTATVVARAWERNALTAIGWLFTPVVPHEGVPSVAAGISFCLSRLVARGVALPAVREDLELDIQRALEAYPLAGLERRSTRPPDLAGSSPPVSLRPSASASLRPSALPASSLPPSLPPASRSSSPVASRSSSPPISGAAVLRTLADADGSVRIGWVESGVLWARFERRLTASLAASYGAHLRELLTGRSDVKYFVDASALESHDLLAQSTSAGALLEHRAQLARVLVLNWQAGQSPLSKAALEALGGAAVVTSQRNVFDSELLDAAPSSMERLGARRSTEPPARLRRHSPS